MNKNVVLLSAALIVGLLVMEASVRLVYPLKTLKQTEVFENYNEPLPNIKGVERDVNNEYFNRFFHNSMGLYSKEIPLEKAEGEYRILLVGDSFTHGIHIPFESKHSTILERKLRETYGDHVTVINGGLGASGTSQQLLFLERKLLAYEPDLILLYFFQGDVEDNLVRGLHRIEDDKLVVELVPYKHRMMKEVREWLGVNSQLYVLFWHVTVQNKLTRNVFTRIGVMQANYINGVFDVTTEDSEGWPVTKLLIKEMRSVAMENDADFAVVSIPFKEQVSGLSMGLSQRELNSFLEEEGIVYLDLLPVFRERNVDNSFYYDIDIHWNIEGDGLAGSVVYEFVVETWGVNDGLS